MTSATRRRLAIQPVEIRSPERPEAEQKRSPYWVLGALALVVAFGLFGYGMASGLSTHAGFIAAPVLLVLWLPMIRHETVMDRGFDAAGLLFFAFGVKMVTAFGRLYMVDEIYSGNGDSTAYHEWGDTLAKSFRSLDFSVDPERPIPGTGFIRVLTGLVYSVVGTDRFVGFLVYSFLGLIGCYLLFAAFATAIPKGHLQKYGLLVFLWPSLVFWPSSIGKEAWMLFGLGLAAWGTARLLEHRRGGLTVFALGITAAYLTRPHIAILVVAAGLIALVMSALFRSGAGVKTFGFASKMATVLVLVIAGSLLAPRVATFLQVDDVGGSGFTEALEQTQERTGEEAGSAFGGAPIEGPLDYPWAFVTVMFRPFPWEVNNFQSAVSALEGLLLIGLLGASLSRLRRIPVEAIRRPYAAFAAGYVFMFCYVFAFIANFGILARQRSQLLPFVFVLVALPLSERAEKRISTYRRQRQIAAEADDEAAADEPPWAQARRGELNIVTTPLGPPRRRR